MTEDSDSAHGSCLEVHGELFFRAPAIDAQKRPKRVIRAQNTMIRALFSTLVGVPGSDVQLHDSDERLL
jgi:hypothetical protein